MELKREPIACTYVHLTYCDDARIPGAGREDSAVLRMPRSSRDIPAGPLKVRLGEGHPGDNMYVSRRISIPKNIVYEIDLDAAHRRC